MEKDPLYNRLVVFGCSFTDFLQWPTWADWMAKYYKYYVKLATGGTGNRAIFHTLVNYLNENPNLTDTHIVIQWSGCPREDKMLSSDSINKKVVKNYSSCGNIFNTYCYPKEYASNYFSIYQSLYETVNYIAVAKELLKNRKIEYTMTFMLNPKVEGFFGEPGFNLQNEVVPSRQLKEYTQLFSKVDSLVDKRFTAKCMTFHQLDTPVTVYTSMNEMGEVQKDGHPSPFQHYSFFTKYIAPKFGIDTTQDSTATLKLVGKWEKYAKIKEYWQNKNHLEPNAWPVMYRYHGQKIIKEYKLI